MWSAAQALARCDSGHDIERRLAVEGDHIW
jgi:hypothetical protein